MALFLLEATSSACFIKCSSLSQMLACLSLQLLALCNTLCRSSSFSVKALYHATMKFMWTTYEKILKKKGKGKKETGNQTLTSTLVQAGSHYAFRLIMSIKTGSLIVPSLSCQNRYAHASRSFPKGVMSEYKNLICSKFTLR